MKVVAHCFTENAHIISQKLYLAFRGIVHHHNHSTTQIRR